MAFQNAIVATKKDPRRNRWGSSSLRATGCLPGDQQTTGGARLATT